MTSRTDDRGYPYPEADCVDGCDGPALVRDAADLPSQLYNLASAVDLDLDELNAAVLAETTGPAAEITGPSQTIGPSQFTFDTIVHEQGGIVTLGTGFTIPSTGLYIVAASAVASSNPADSLTLNLQVNGSTISRTTVNPATSGANDAMMNASAVRPLNEGDAITLMWTQATAPAPDRTWTSVRMGIARYRSL